LKGILEERAVELGEYIIEQKATVRSTAKKFGISKSTVHTVVTIWNGLLFLNNIKKMSS
jgi:putative DeoR family transcriptional regulator (stage III sporulation protein D)